MDIRQVKNFNMLINLPLQPLDGEIAMCEEENKLYKYINNKWEEYIPTLANGDSGFQMSLNDLNKMIIKQLPPIENFDDKVDLIQEWAIKTNNTFYMLFSKEIGYFTLFQYVDSLPEFITLGRGVIEVLLENGYLINSIELTEDETGIEIWVKDEEDCYCMYLFPYDIGIVRIGD